VVDEEDEDALRQLAKDSGIGYWWTKSPERLREELADLPEAE